MILADEFLQTDDGLYQIKRLTRARVRDQTINLTLVQVRDQAVDLELGPAHNTDLVTLTLDNGLTLTATPRTRVETTRGFVPIQNLLDRDRVVLSTPYSRVRDLGMTISEVLTAAYACGHSPYYLDDLLKDLEIPGEKPADKAKLLTLLDPKTLDLTPTCLLLNQTMADELARAILTKDLLEVDGMTLTPIPYRNSQRKILSLLLRLVGYEFTIAPVRKLWSEQSDNYWRVELARGPQTRWGWGLHRDDQKEAFQQPRPGLWLSFPVTVTSYSYHFEDQVATTDFDGVLEVSGFRIQRPLPMT